MTTGREGVLASSALDAAIADGMVTNIPHRGLPRELTAEGEPIPFAVKQSAQGVAWAEIDPKLTLLCTLDARCHMCGEHVADEDAWAINDIMGRAVDGWVMHRRCTKLAAAHCPYLRRALDDHMFVDRAAETAPLLRGQAIAKSVRREPA